MIAYFGGSTQDARAAPGLRRPAGSGLTPLAAGPIGASGPPDRTAGRPSPRPSLVGTPPDGRDALIIGPAGGLPGGRPDRAKGVHSPYGARPGIRKTENADPKHSDRVTTAAADTGNDQ